MIRSSSGVEEGVDGGVVEDREVELRMGEEVGVFPGYEVADDVGFGAVGDVRELLELAEGFRGHADAFDDGFFHGGSGN